jgi:hypothetical protein
VLRRRRDQAAQHGCGQRFRRLGNDDHHPEASGHPDCDGQHDDLLYGPEHDDDYHAQVNDSYYDKGKKKSVTICNVTCRKTGLKSSYWSCLKACFYVYTFSFYK